MCTLTPGQTAARGVLEARDDSASRLPWCKHLLLVAQALPGTVIQQGLGNQTFCAWSPGSKKDENGHIMRRMLRVDEEQIVGSGYHFYFMTLPRTS